jgi:8-hydroxy-5-deazaflavin:NADPH oxidoreductase
MMKIAIIGTGNIGAALATKWAQAGHEINLGVRNLQAFKGMELLNKPGIKAFPSSEAVSRSEVILLAVPAMHVVDTVKALGDTSGKIIIDTMNIVNGRGPEGYQQTTAAILATTQTRDVVKCFNSTGFNNIVNTGYHAQTLDMFMAGDSLTGKQITAQLAKDAGFETCYDIGGNDKFSLLEQFALFWINLAMVQGMGRDIGFKLLKR